MPPVNIPPVNHPAVDMPPVNIPPVNHPPVDMSPVNIPPVNIPPHDFPVPPNTIPSLEPLFPILSASRKPDHGGDYPPYPPSKHGPKEPPKDGPKGGPKLYPLKNEQGTLRRTSSINVPPVNILPHQHPRVDMPPLDHPPVNIPPLNIPPHDFPVPPIIVSTLEPLFPILSASFKPDRNGGQPSRPSFKHGPKDPPESGPKLYSLKNNEEKPEAPKKRPGDKERPSPPKKGPGDKERPSPPKKGPGDKERPSPPSRKI
jgi:hypothetical protein